MIIRHIPNGGGALLQGDRLRLFTSALLRIGAAVVLLAMPLCILSHGYLPPDDALRHAAKAVSGKSWQQILVMRSDITIDHNAGWAAILGALHRGLGWDAERLVQFSVILLFLLFAWAPLFSFRFHETWLASLAVILLTFPYFAARTFVGRPLLVTMAVSLLLLCQWTRPGRNLFSAVNLLSSVLLIAIAVWVHGSWYVFALLPMAFFLARQWREGFLLTLCWLLGALLGALWTGAPFAYLKQAILILFLALGKNAPANSLAGEFQPFTGSYPAVLIIGAILIWRQFAGKPFIQIFRDPVLLLALLGLLLGFRVLRFWLDWGIPALALWLARQVQELLEPHLKEIKWRLVLSIVSACALLAGVASDRSGRWSQLGSFEALDARQPDQAEWLPGTGGILYNVDLAVFFQTFFKNPHGDWRYILGFEPSFMRAEDLAVYQELWQTLNALQACSHWVKRMTPADRMVLRGGPRTRPGIRELEWRYVVKDTWVGRVPRVAN